MNMLVKLWFYRKLGLPFYITPKLSLSRVGIIGQELQSKSYLGLVISRVLANFLNKNLSSLKDSVKGNYFVSILDKDSINSICFPFEEYWINFQNQISVNGLHYILNSIQLDESGLRELAKNNFNEHQPFYTEFGGGEYWNKRVPEEKELEVFNADLFTCYFLTVRHPEYGDFSQYFLDFPLEVSEDVGFQDEAFRGYLAYRMAAYCFITYSELLPSEIIQQICEHGGRITPKDEMS